MHRSVFAMSRLGQPKQTAVICEVCIALCSPSHAQNVTGYIASAKHATARAVLAHSASAAADAAAAAAAAAAASAAGGARVAAKHSCSERISGFTWSKHVYCKIDALPFRGGPDADAR